MTSKPIYYWHNIDKPLQDKLMSSQFVKMDCLADSDCGPRPIETALKHAGLKTSPKRLRDEVIKYINYISNQVFAVIISNYREEKTNGVFIGNWNPSEITSKRDFIRVIRDPEFQFQGDDVTLSILTAVLKTDFIVVNEKEKLIINTSNSDSANINSQIIILLYTPLENIGNFEAIGLKVKQGSKRSTIETRFLRDELPIEVLRLVDKNELYKYIIQNICDKETCNVKSIHNIISEIELQTGEVIKQKNRQLLIKMLYTWIENNNYLKKMKKYVEID